MPGQIVRRTKKTVRHEVRDGRNVKVTNRKTSRPTDETVDTDVRHEVRNGKRVKVTVRTYKRSTAA